MLSQSRKKNHLADKEFVRVITRDGVRDLLVPSSKPNAYTELWPESKLSRLQANAKVLTVEDKMHELEIRVKSNEKLKEESERRKQKLREIDTARVAKREDQKETFVDESDNLKLLDRAFLAKQERVRVDLRNQSTQIPFNEARKNYRELNFFDSFLRTICLTQIRSSIFLSAGRRSEKSKSHYPCHKMLDNTRCSNCREE